MNVGGREYINHHYVIVWQHPEAVESDWNIFLLEETYNCEIAKKVNGLFISLFSPPGSVFVTEGQDYLKKSLCPELILELYRVSTPNIPPENVIGWDMREYALFSESKAKARMLIIDILRGMQEVCRESSFESINWKEINWKNLMLDLWNQEQEQNSLQVQNQLTYLFRCISEAICDIAREMQEFCEQEIVPKRDAYLEKKGIKKEKLIEEFAKFDSSIQIFNPDRTVSETFLPRLIFMDDHPENNIIVKKSLDFLESYLAFDTLLSNQLDKYIKEERAILMKQFPIQTHAMITTLKNIEFFISSDKGIVHLVAGKRHLEEDPNVSEEEKRFLSLKTFYNFLEEHKNIVILRPKIPSQFPSLHGFCFQLI
jgi:hypothetical protein